MRDVHGRYSDQKALRDSAPAWAVGCGKCKLGVLAAPDLTGLLPLYEQRAVAAHEEMIVFCDCKAGLLSRQHLGKVYATIGWQSARNIVEHIRAAATPSVHLEAA